MSFNVAQTATKSLKHGVDAFQAGRDMLSGSIFPDLESLVKIALLGEGNKSIVGAGLMVIRNFIVMPVVGKRFQVVGLADKVGSRLYAGYRVLTGSKEDKIDGATDLAEALFAGRRQKVFHGTLRSQFMKTADFKDLKRAINTNTKAGRKAYKALYGNIEDASTDVGKRFLSFLDKNSDSADIKRMFESNMDKYRKASRKRMAPSMNAVAHEVEHWQQVFSPITSKFRSNAKETARELVGAS